MAEVVEAAGMEARPLGRIIKVAGLQVNNTTGTGVTNRYYIVELKEKVEKMLEVASW